MQIVIDIPKEVYKRYRHEYSEDEDLISDYVTEAILIAFAKGIVLPEGHGRLIDVDALQKKVEKHRSMLKILIYDRELILHYTDVEMAPVIIEADTPKKRKGTSLEENDSGYNCENWIP